MKKRLRVILIGYYVKKQAITFDGQSGRTRALFSSLKEMDLNLKLIDTDQYQRNPIALAIASIFALFANDVIVVCLARKGSKSLLPPLIKINSFFKRRIIYIPIGLSIFADLDSHQRENDLNNMLKNVDEIAFTPAHNIFSNALKKTSQIFVETETIKRLAARMYNLDSQKIGVLYNYKDEKLINYFGGEANHDGNLHLYFDSRLCEEKGLKDLVDAIILYNSSERNKCIYLDIYGMLHDFYEREFNELKTQFGYYIRYLGTYNPYEFKGLFSKYDAMVFPTKHLEGFPGNILIAYFSGIPIISTNFGSAAELIKDGLTGYIYNGTREDLFRVFDSVNEEGLFSLRNNCYSLAKEFTSQAIEIKLKRFLFEGICE
ncbi:MAG: glycosyltransferase [Bacilli bacterium]|jgi:glycosyltransferase involved in cell wall biosynthesis